MAKIALWNSIAKRRRSISDTFYDNGLATLKGYLEDKGHNVEIIDWARDDFFSSLSQGTITKWLRNIYSRMLGSKNKIVKKMLGLISLELQEILNAAQDKLLKKRLRELAHQLKNKQTRLLGVKIWYGEAFKNAKYLVSRINKIAPEIITIAGGYHVTLYEEKILEKSDFDLGVSCEGEFTLEALLNIADKHKEHWAKDKVLEEITNLGEEKKLDNLIYRKNGRIVKTNRRYVAAQSLKSVPKYSVDENKVSIHVMVESLGCDWGKCHFCVHPYFYPHYSLRDPEEIVREIEEMRKIGIGVFRFAGSDTPPALGAKIAQKILDKKMKVIFGMGSRAIRGAKEKFDTLVTDYTILIQGGLRSVFMGGESGNEFVNQTAMNKGISFEDTVYSIKALREAEKKAGEKIYISLAFIYPAPLLGKVTLAQVKEDNIRLLKETMPDSVMITPPGPFLHTRWYEEKDKFGFQVKDDVINQAMEYEYVLYKPPELWPKLGISLEGKSFKKLLSECNDFRNSVENGLGIPTDISDEHFLMFYSAGIKDKEGILKIKKETMLDIVSCDYTATRELSRKVNDFSKMISAIV